MKARPVDWPDVDSPRECRQWLARIWGDTAFVVPLRAAAPGLADFVERIVDVGDVTPKRVRKATCSVARYLLRASARATPFGLFAGVALAEAGPISAEISTGHQPLARPDTLWVDHVRRALQGRADVLPHLALQVNNLSCRRGDVLITPRSGGRLASTPLARPLTVLLDAATDPAPGRHLMHLLAEAGGTPEQIVRLIGKALEDEYLISNLTAPMTVTDPAAHIVRTLLPHEGVLESGTLALLDCLSKAQMALAIHNQAAPEQTHRLRAAAEERMRDVPAECRSRISLDLHLDAEVRVPHQVLREAERAAHALVRLTRTHGESPQWAAYQTHFWERYGAGVLVPVRDAADLAAGIGLPADYPMSVWSEKPLRVLPRDEQLAAMAMQAAVTGAREVFLTDEDIDGFATPEPEVPVAPHVEMAFRIRALSQEDVAHGDFRIDVRPSWTTGVLSGRFTEVLGSRLSDPYRTLPTMTQGALSAQLSFVPSFPHAQNIARIPAVLPHVISVGEIREPTGDVIGVDDLAVYSTGRQLHLVSMSRRRIVEPLVFHPLALEKQAPPLARFLAMVGRGFATAWTAFDWGPAAAGLPWLPRVRYGRAILAPARWKLSAATLPSGAFGSAWHKALSDWALAWRCPPRLELRDDDRTISVVLAEPLHARLIHDQVRRRGFVVFTETVSDEELGWIGHAHEITVALASTRPQMPHPDLSTVPVVRNHEAGAVGQRWTQAKVFTHPTVMDQVISERIPRLCEGLGTCGVWFVRYRSLEESDHLRIRVPATDPGGQAATLRILTAWMEQLTADRLASHLTIDGYRPEVGRYGTGAAMTAAEDVFVADSLVARYALTDLPHLESEMVCALSMIDVAEGLLGIGEGRAWMAETPAPVDCPQQGAGPASPSPMRDASPRLAQAMDQRRSALAAYRSAINDERRLDQTLESLLHMHHNRLAGPDRDSEAAARHTARQACRSLLLRERA
ncbi:lantibiotic dehydratase [Streptomyces sp. NPDC050439]|uniref:lantibiotic dehydratase n=1 Tax=unclassified Streptomyces TaxID=2593676 RepID=UPI003432F24F